MGASAGGPLSPGLGRTHRPGRSLGLIQRRIRPTCRDCSSRYPATCSPHYLLLHRLCPAEPSRATRWRHPMGSGVQYLTSPQRPYAWRRFSSQVNVSFHRTSVQSGAQQAPLAWWLAPPASHNVQIRSLSLCIHVYSYCAHTSHSFSHGPTIPGPPPLDPPPSWVSEALAPSNPRITTLEMNLPNKCILSSLVFGICFLCNRQKPTIPRTRCTQRPCLFAPQPRPVALPSRCVFRDASLIRHVADQSMHGFEHS